MLGDTLTMTIGGAGGTAKVLSKINQDAYASEYLLRSTTDEYRVRVRHTREQPKNGAAALDRHNMEITHTIFATPTAVEVTRNVYFVVRVKPGDDIAAACNDALALFYWASAANLTKLVGWES